MDFFAWYFSIQGCSREKKKIDIFWASFWKRVKSVGCFFKGGISLAPPGERERAAFLKTNTYKNKKTKTNTERQTQTQIQCKYTHTNTKNTKYTIGTTSSLRYHWVNFDDRNCPTRSGFSKFLAVYRLTTNSPKTVAIS